MAININELHPALLKAKEVATQEYVDGAIPDLSSYVTSQEVTNAIVNDMTSIDGSRITTGTIAAARIDTESLHVKAANVDGTLYGKTIVGGHIKGAIIETAYIDLEGDGTSLVTSYTGCAESSVGAIEINTVSDPSLPAIYEYRLPTMPQVYVPSYVWSDSVIQYNTSSVSKTINHTQKWDIYSYDSCGVSTFSRARNSAPKIRTEEATLWKTDVWFANTNYGWYPAVGLEDSYYKFTLNYGITSKSITWGFYFTDQWGYKRRWKKNGEWYGSEITYYTDEGGNWVTDNPYTPFPYTESFFGIPITFYSDRITVDTDNAYVTLDELSGVTGEISHTIESTMVVGPLPTLGNKGRMTTYMYSPSGLHMTNL